MLLSSIPSCNLVEHSKSSLEGLLYISFVSWQGWWCLSWLGEGSRLLEPRLSVSHVFFLGELVCVAPLASASSLIHSSQWRKLHGSL